MPQCELCKSSKSDDVKYGEFLSKKNISVHLHCLYLSSNLAQSGEDHEGFLGFLPADIKQECKRISRLTCCYCGKAYANIGCCSVKCRRTFHTICGLENGVENHFSGTFQSYCDQHIHKVKYRPARNELCCICYDSLTAQNNGKFNSIEQLRAPCCRNGWFHKLCLQTFARSAGYFFKCPLCNDKDEFCQKLAHRGIYIPNRDAAWELEPNAFSDLLERPNNCTAVECKNKRGRTEQTEQNPLLLCITCGSVAMHKLCQSSHSAGGKHGSRNNTNFQCADCQQLLNAADSGRESLEDQQNEAEAESTLSTLDEDDEDSFVNVCDDIDSESESKIVTDKVKNDKNCQEVEDEDDEQIIARPKKPYRSRLILDDSVEDTDEECITKCRSNAKIHQKDLNKTSSDDEELDDEQKSKEDEDEEEKQNKENLIALQKNLNQARKNLDSVEDKQNIKCDSDNDSDSSSDDEEEIFKSKIRALASKRNYDSESESNLESVSTTTACNSKRSLVSASHSTNLKDDTSSGDDDDDPLDDFYAYMKKKQQPEVQSSISCVAQRSEASAAQAAKRSTQEKCEINKKHFEENQNSAADHFQTGVSQKSTNIEEVLIAEDEKENDNFTKPKALDISCIAKRTRRKSLYLERETKSQSELETPIPKQLKHEVPAQLVEEAIQIKRPEQTQEVATSSSKNILDISCIAKRTRRKSFSAADFSPAVSNSKTQTPNSANFVADTDDDDTSRESVSSYSSAYAISSVAAKTPNQFNPLDISCIGNRTRKRKSLCAARLTCIPETPTFARNSSKCYSVASSIDAITSDETTTESFYSLSGSSSNSSTRLKYPFEPKRNSKETTPRRPSSSCSASSRQNSNSSSLPNNRLRQRLSSYNDADADDEHCDDTPISTRGHASSTATSNCSSSVNIQFDMYKTPKLRRVSSKLPATTSASSTSSSSAGKSFWKSYDYNVQSGNSSSGGNSSSDERRRCSTNVTVRRHKSSTSQK